MFDEDQFDAAGAAGSFEGLDSGARERQQQVYGNDNEYYNFLNVPRDASQAEINGAYKRLSRLYHPDKHVDQENKEKAEALFSKLKKAHAVLSDPHQRAIYDCLGKKGLREQGWQIVQRRKTPREIRDEYEQLARERAERRLQQRTNPTSRLQMTINASELFDRYYSDEDTFEDDEEEEEARGLDLASLVVAPPLEVTEITVNQSIEFPLSNSETVILNGGASTDNGRGRGNLGFTWKRVTSERSWHQFELGLGNGSAPKPTLGGKYFRRLTDKIFVTVNGSIARGIGGNSINNFLFLKPAFSVSLGNQLTRHAVGYLSYSTNWNISETSDAFSLTEEQSGMSTMLVRTTEKYHLMLSVQLGIPYTYVAASMVRKFKDPKNKVRVAGRFGSFGAIAEYGAEKKISTHSVLGATMVFGVPVGVTLKIKVQRAQQTYLFPVHLSDEVMTMPLFYGTVAPVLVWFAVQKLILDPFEARKSAAEKEKKLNAAKEKIAKARIEAQGSVSLMRQRFMRIRSEAEAKSGLVVILALYGKIVNPDKSLLMLDSLAQLESYDSEAVALELSERNLHEVIDVTVPVQCLCEDGARINLFGGGSKADLPGFYNPVAELEEDFKSAEDAEEDKEHVATKHLLIFYRYQEMMHKVLVKDAEAIRLPRTSHRINGQLQVNA